MWELFLIYRGLVQQVLFLLLTAYALRRGDGPEKMAGLTVCAMIAFDYGYHLLFPAPGLIYNHIDLGHLAQDVLGLILMTLLAMRANRIYPIWILAAQIVSVAMHFERSLFSTIDHTVYQILTMAPSWVQLVAFAAGLVAHRRRVRIHGSYRPWRHS